MTSLGLNKMTTGSIMYIGIYLIVLYAAVWDYKQRIIPDKVSAALILIGLAGTFFIPADDNAFISLGARLLGAAIPAITLLVIYQFHKRIGGGDLKLLTALGFTLGLNALVVVLMSTTITATIWSWRHHQNSVALAVFLAIGLTVYYVLLRIV